MPVFNFLSGHFIDIIAWTDDTRDTMVWRFERHGHEIKYGAKLTVREGQTAVLVHEGQLADVFSPGLYMLETNNMPVMTALQHWNHGFRSPFKSEIYFVSATRFTNLKWGTRNPIMIRDPEFGPTRVRAYGTYAVKITDPARFLTEIVGTDGEFTSDEVSFQLRNIVVQEFSRVVASSGVPVLDMAANTADFGRLVARETTATLDAYGLTMPEFYVENISLPSTVEKALDERTSRGIIGSPGKRFNPGNAKVSSRAGSAAGRSTGMDAGYGRRMDNAAGAPPPPPPVEHVWHIAENGLTKGPFSKARMGRMAIGGELTRETLVWTAGQDGWMPAGEISELAPLFTVMPPPPPPPA